MNLTTITTTLQQWETAVIDLDAQTQPLFRAFGNHPEAPLPAAIDSLIEAYTKLVASTIDWDEGTLIDWWCHHHFGETPMQIGLHGQPMRTIQSTEELAQFIADDHNQAANHAQGDRTMRAQELGISEIDYSVLFQQGIASHAEAWSSNLVESYKSVMSTRFGSAAAAAFEDGVNYANGQPIDGRTIHD